MINQNPNFDWTRIHQALERFYCESHGAGPGTDDPRTAEFLFHMTDWNEDLQTLVRLYRDPDAYDSDAWAEGISGFLLHAVGHLRAAAKLDGWDTSVFEEKNEVSTASKSNISTPGMP